MSIPTPPIATKSVNFSNNQKSYVKNNADLNGCDIYNITFSAAVYNVPIKLLEMYLYTFYSNTAIVDGATFEDVDTNQYTAFVFNKSSIAIGEFFRARIIGDTIYLYTY